MPSSNPYSALPSWTRVDPAPYGIKRSIVYTALCPKCYKDAEWTGTTQETQALRFSFEVHIVCSSCGWCE